MGCQIRHPEMKEYHDAKVMETKGTRMEIQKGKRKGKRNTKLTSDIGSCLIGASQGMLSKCSSAEES